MAALAAAPLRLSPRAIFHPTVLLSLALMTVIVMMVLPVPAWILDVGLAGGWNGDYLPPFHAEMARRYEMSEGARA